MLKPHKIYFVLMSCLVIVFTSCKTEKYKLGNKKLVQKFKTTNNSLKIKSIKPIISPQQTNLLKFQENTVKYKNKTYKFYDLAAAPLFDMSLNEQKVLGLLLKFFDEFSCNSFKSMEEADVSKFVSEILFDASKIKLHPDLLILLSKIKKYVLPIYLYKQIDINHTPNFSFDEFSRFVYKLYSKGFNLNSTSKKELDEFLSQLEEICWKSKRGKLLSNKIFNKFMKKITHYIDNKDKKELESFYKSLLMSVKVQNKYYKLLKFLLYSFNSHNNYIALWLNYPAGDEFLNFFNILTSYVLPQNPFFLKLKTGNIYPLDTYLLLETGSCALCLKREKIPGYLYYPKNLRQTDWNQYGKDLTRILGTPLKTEITKCMSGTLDFTAVFEKFLINSSGYEGESLSGYNLNKQFADGKIIKRFWINLITSYSALQQNLSDDFLRRECKLGPIRYYSYRYLYEESLNSKTLIHIADEFFIKALWFEYKSLKNTSDNKKNNTTNKQKTTKNIENHKNITTNKQENTTEDKQENTKSIENHKKNNEDTTIKEVLTSVYFPADPKFSFLYDPRIMQSILIKMANDINSNPILFLQKLKSLTKYNLISNEKKEKLKKHYNKYVPDVRVYMPTQIYIKNNRIYYRRASEPLNYFLKSYFPNENF